jgi:hypothetical protein
MNLQQHQPDGDKPDDKHRYDGQSDTEPRVDIEAPRSYPARLLRSTSIVPAGAPLLQFLGASGRDALTMSSSCRTRSLNAAICFIIGQPIIMPPCIIPWPGCGWL